MRVVIFIAGTNEPSNAAQLAAWFAEGMGAIPGAQITTFHLKDLNIDHFSLRHYDQAADQGKDFTAIQTAVEQADGLVVSTPIWNFSIPGHLKNLIDRMGSFGLDEQSRSVGMLKGKPVYLLYTGGSPAVVWTGLQRRTLSHMPVSLRYFGLSPLGSHYEPRCTLGKGKFGLVVDARVSTKSAMLAKGQSFGRIVDYYAKHNQLPLKQKILNTIFRLGQKAKRKLRI